MKRLYGFLGLSLLLVSCNMGNNNSGSNNSTNNANLEGYISRLSYVPVANKGTYEVSSLKTALGLKNFGSNGNQTSIYISSPVNLSSIVVAYYNDTVCNNQVALTSFNGNVEMQAGTYYTSDASNEYLCSQYNYNSRSGCGGALSGAQAGDYKSMQVIYNFTNGSSSRSLCLYNQFNGNGYEATANYSDPQNPIACSSSNCGYSKSYLTSEVGINSFSIAGDSADTNIANSCYLSESSNNNLECWGVPGTGSVGNGYVIYPAMMPAGVESFSLVSTNTSFSCGVAGGGSNRGKIYCWGVGTSGQIGNGANLSVNIPTSVTMPSGVTAFSQVSTNTNFSCAIAASGDDAGKVFCWGNGGSGQIGNGANSSVNVPTSVTMPSGVTAFSQIATSMSNSCAIASSGDNAGRVYCWGVGSNGQIGNGSNVSPINIPTSVTMPSGVTAFSQISNNGSFNCAIASSGESAGRVYCWGMGANGRIGNGGISDVYVPTSVTMPLGVTAFGQISTGINFSCALASSGESAGNIYCWGTGGSGQIGNGVSSNVNVPTSVTMPSGVTAFSQISTNASFSCALASSGESAGNIYCWGTGGSGQIGNGVSSNVNVPTSVTMPSGVTAFSQISTNASFSCAIAGSGDNAGKVYCWGAGTNGQIGNGISNDASVPTPIVTINGVDSFNQISTNPTFSCAIANSGANTGKIYCWGGSLSVSRMGSAGVPSPLTASLPTGVGVYNQLSTNTTFSCAIAGSGESAGRVYCWGGGSNNQIGNGVNANVNIPTSVTMPPGVTRFSQISTNSSFSCAIAGSGESAGRVYCWGTGSSGQIGNGGNSSASVPTSVTMPSGVTSFSQVSTNSSFSCAIASSGESAGRVYCWGNGSNGRIGNGGSSNALVPTSVTMPSGVTAFNQISTNTNFSCAIASSGESAGRVYCWGSGGNGKIGNGGGSNALVPTSVTMPSGVTAFNQISTNTAFSCAIASSGESAGRVYCWGLGSSGQIGNGSSSVATVPTSVIMPSDVLSFFQVATSTDFSCAIASSGGGAGKVYCWGTGTSGQIGNGLNNNVNKPTSVIMPSGVDSFGKVWVTNFYACAIAATGINKGRRYCWGANATGQLGTGTGISTNVPTLLN
jgi:alpha-tubulin suppressor-like RCC1 family protein